MPSFIVPRPALSRRAMLRGMGAAVALPFLDAMRPLRGAESGKYPVRLGVIFMPNGVRQDKWTPEGEGTNFKLSPILQPIERHRADLNIFTRLGHKNCEAGD